MFSLHGIPAIDIKEFEVSLVSHNLKNDHFPSLGSIITVFGLNSSLNQLKVLHNVQESVTAF